MKGMTMLCDLFSVTTDIKDKLGNGTRQANEAEAKAYADFLRRRRDLPDLGHCDLHILSIGAGRRGGFIYQGATFGRRIAAPHNIKQPGGEFRHVPAEYENGAFSVIFPGHDMHRARVKFEELDEAGETVKASTLPVEPKKGGVIWSREDVRKAAGKVEKPGKVKAAPAADPIPVACDPAPTVEMATQEPQERAEEPPAPHAYPEPVKALSEAEAGESEAIEPYDAIVKLPEVDPIAELLARVEALEARVEALPADMVAPPIAAAGRPARTVAHERAIRRAWAERKARRRSDAISADRFSQLVETSGKLSTAESNLRMGQAQYDGLKADLAEARTRLQAKQELLDAENENYRALARLLDRIAAKRRRAVLNARILQTRLWSECALVDRYRGEVKAAKVEAEGAQGRADMAQAELARIKRDMADPSQPERANDIARLIQERDAARTAAAATDARNRALQSAVDGLADKFEGMVSRVSRAEAAMRAAGLTLAA
jgi:hypothetical protein